jgi:flagellar basal-body rod protein FlgG
MALIALHSGATGLSAQSTALDVIANNLANVNTDGFKASRVNFQDLLYLEKAQPGVENANGDQRPVGTYVGLGVKIAGTILDFGTGAANRTDRELDIMIEGPGFFQVEIDDEVGEGIGYTRAGSFALNSEGEFVLINDQGRRLIPEIVVPEGASSISVSNDGIVSAAVPGQIEEVEIGQLQLATFINPAGLKQIGENLFVPSVASGDPSIGDPLDGGRGGLRQGFLEGSNVDPVTELVNLIRTQRAFELNSQTIQAADQVLQGVSNLRRF